MINSRIMNTNKYTTWSISEVIGLFWDIKEWNEVSHKITI